MQKILEKSLSFFGNDLLKDPKIAPLVNNFSEESQQNNFSLNMISVINDFYPKALDEISKSNNFLSLKEDLNQAENLENSLKIKRIIFTNNDNLVVTKNNFTISNEKKTTRNIVEIREVKEASQNNNLTEKILFSKFKRKNVKSIYDCPHLERVHHAKGMCRQCYQNCYFAKKKMKKGEFGDSLDLENLETDMKSNSKTRSHSFNSQEYLLANNSYKIRFENNRDISFLTDKN